MSLAGGAPSFKAPCCKSQPMRCLDNSIRLWPCLKRSGETAWLRGRNELNELDTTIGVCHVSLFSPKLCQIPQRVPWKGRKKANWPAQREGGQRGIPYDTNPVPGHYPGPSAADVPDFGDVITFNPFKGRVPTQIAVFSETNPITGTKHLLRMAFWGVKKGVLWYLLRR